MAHGERRSVTIGIGAIAGGLAWLVGYGVAYTVGREPVRSDFEIQLLGVFADEPVAWRVVGWLYYNAHAVDLLVPPIGPFGGSRSNHVLADPSLHPFLLLPPGVLAVAGGVVAWYTRDLSGDNGADPPRASDAALAGATVVTGYLVVTVVGLVVFAATLETGTVRPRPLTAVVVAGVLYPAVFGGSGGLVAWGLRP